MIEPEIRMWMAVMNRVYLDSKSENTEIRAEIKRFICTPEFSYICEIIEIAPKKVTNALYS